MKTSLHLLIASLLLSASPLSARAQGFDAGSNGSLGELTLTDADLTVALPPDGRLQYAKITVAAGRTLRFKRNDLNTPVQLLAQGDIVVDGIIDVSGNPAPGTPPIGGFGGPGGFDGGKPGFGAAFPPGDGYGPGAGGSGTTGDDGKSAGGAGYGEPGGGGSCAFKGGTYGSPLLNPLMGGSGGGGDTGTPGNGGGGGGGAILVASNTRIRVSGSIDALGANWRGASHDAGSGGAIRLLAPKVEGGGQIRVQGGSSGGGAGRIRVDSLDKTSLKLSFQPLSVTTVGANMFVDPFTTPATTINDGTSNTIILGEKKCPGWTSRPWPDKWFPSTTAAPFASSFPSARTRIAP